MHPHLAALHTIHKRWECILIEIQHLCMHAMSRYMGQADHSCTSINVPPQSERLRYPRGRYECLYSGSETTSFPFHPKACHSRSTSCRCSLLISTCTVEKTCLADDYVQLFWSTAGSYALPVVELWASVSTPFSQGRLERRNNIKAGISTGSGFKRYHPVLACLSQSARYLQ